MKIPFFGIKGLKPGFDSMDVKADRFCDLFERYVETQMMQTDFENPLCIVSQEWTYALDNTGTRFSNENTIKMTLDDGRCIEFTQPAITAGSWAAQLTDWAAQIQAGADALGLQWLAEPRFVDNPNPPNIDGTINGPGGTPSGLPGAPDSTIAVALIDGGIAWRYVNIQICPGEPVPTRLQLLAVNGEELETPRDLLTVGAILGPKNRFRVFYEVDKETGEPCETWFIYDLSRPDPKKRWREAADGEIPFCFFKDGDSAATAVPPSSDCVFEFDKACDSNGSDLAADFIQEVTRRVTFCNGEKIAQDFFVPDPEGPAALVPHELVGKYVDCATGEEVEVPAPPCLDFDIVELFAIENKTPGARNREWVTDLPILPQGDLDAARALVAGFDYSVAPNTDTIVTANIAAINDTANTGAVLDFQIREGYLCVLEPTPIRWQANSEGSIFFEIGECGGALKEVQALSKGVGIQATSGYVIPVGFHQYRLINVDNGGTNSSWVAQTQANGVDWSNADNILDDLSSTTQPIEVCKKVKVCKDTGVFIDLITGKVLEPSQCRPCALKDQLAALNSNITALIGEGDKCPCDPSIEPDKRCRSYASVLASGYRNWQDPDDNEDLASEFGITPTNPAEIWLRITEFKCDGVAQSSEGQVLGPYVVDAAGTGYTQMQADLQAATASACLQLSDSGGGGSNGQNGFNYDYDSTMQATLVVQEGFTVGGGVQWATSAQGFVVRDGQAGDFISSTGNGATTNYDAITDAGDIESYTDAEDCEAI